MNGAAEKHYRPRTAVEIAEDARRRLEQRVRTVAAELQARALLANEVETHDALVGAAQLVRETLSRERQLREQLDLHEQREEGRL